MARWRVGWILTGALLLAAAFTYSSWGEIRRHRRSVCSGCGAFWVEEWVLGIKQVDQIEKADLAYWADRLRDPGAAHRWHLLSETTSNAYGHTNSCACGIGHAVIYALSMLKNSPLDDSAAAGLIRELDECDETKLSAFISSLPGRTHAIR